MTCVLNEVAAHQKGRQVLVSRVIDSIDKEGERLHFWGIEGGTTILLRQEGKHFVSWEELEVPIGIAINLYFKQPQSDAVAA